MGPDIDIKTNAQRICRACLSISDSVTDMIDLLDGNDLVQIYIQCTSLPLTRCDGLSQFICLDCNQKFQKFYQFRTGCIDAYNYLNEQHMNDELILEGDAVQLKGKKSQIAASIQNQKLPINANTKEEVEDEKDCDYVIFLNEPLDNDDNYTYVEIDDNIDKLEENTENDNDDDDGHRMSDDANANEADAMENDKDADDIDNDDEDSSERAKLICDICQKGFFKKHRLEGHLRQHKGLKQWDCKHCDKSFAKWTTFTAHKSYYHGNDEEKIDYKCDYIGCDKAYPMKSSLNIHIKKKHMDQPKPTVPLYNFICEHCGKSFKSNSALTKHVYTHLPSLMPFRCKICPKKYPTKHKLKEHVMRHEGIKNYVCTLCGLRKTTGHELKVHMNYHTKDKQFPCEYCPRIFSNVGNRSRHIKIVHCGVKEYKCTHCEKSFGKAETLKHHIMTHTGEKPLACQICDKRFIQPIALKTHMKTHSKAKT